MIYNWWHFTLLSVLAFMIELSSSLYFKPLLNFPCYKPEYQQRRFDCKNKFFLSFRTNPYRSCKEEADKLAKCTLIVDQDCLKEADPTTFLYESYKNISMNPNVKRIERVYCRDAGLLSRNVSKQSTERKICGLKMHKEKSRCIKAFQRLWRQDRGRKDLCKKYGLMGKCIQHAKKTYCSGETARIMDGIRLLMDKLVPPMNPFCVHERSIL